jgi:hypothetical protein
VDNPPRLRLRNFASRGQTTYRLIFCKWVGLALNALLPVPSVGATTVTVAGLEAEPALLLTVMTTLWVPALSPLTLKALLRSGAKLLRDSPGIN